MQNIYTDGSYEEHNKTWHEEDSSWKAGQIAHMIKKNDLHPSTICEIGCGAGGILQHLSEGLGDEVVLTGYEISPQAFELCRRKAKSNLSFILDDLLTINEVSFDIVMAIDVIEHALRLTDVEWFVLATGDSDFSPLFRRLREMGKEVIGTGPRSPLSESVKTSCSKFIYTDKVEPISKEVLNSSLDDTIDLVEKALKTFDAPVLCSVLKQSMTNMDSAFDEKLFGFKSFTDFLKNIEFIDLTFDAKQKVNNVSLALKKEVTVPINPLEIQYSLGLLPGILRLPIVSIAN